MKSSAGLRRWLLIVVAGLAAVAAGVEFGRWSRTPERQTSFTPDTGNAASQLLNMPLMTLDQKPQKLTAWKGKVLVINFWATWCPPCREEMPEFSLAQDQYGPNGIQFIGIAIDSLANVVEFDAKTPISYPLLIAPDDMASFTARLGNQAQALPFTVIIDRDNKLVSSHLGRLSKEDLAKKLAPLL